MKLAATCIKHRVMIILLYILIVVFGFASFQGLALALMPTMELPVALVMTTYPGAGPEEVENLVTRPVEETVARIAGMDTLMSRSQENVSIVIVQFADGTNMDNTLTDIRAKIDQMKGSLPDDANAPTVIEMDPDAMPVIQFGVMGSDLANLQSIAEDTIGPALERIDGVASVDITGGYTTEVAIDMDTDRMRGYNLSISYISQMLSAENVTIPAGSVQNGTKKLTVRTTGEYKSVQDIANTIIPLPTGGTVRLSEIAHVYETHDDVDNISKINGQECVQISVNKRSGVNTAAVAEEAAAAMAKLHEEKIPQVEYLALMDQSDYINQSVDSVLQNIIIGVVLAALVLFVFLRNFGATAVIAVAMPLCILTTFLIMRGLNITMNLMSLGGMAMGVGMIVDNSIVVLENIYRFRDEGHSRYESCIYGTGEVGLSVMASTLTTVAVFLPIALAGGIAGMMFKEFCLTIVSLLMSSLLIALTLVPLLCYILLDRGQTKPKLRAKQVEKQAKRLAKQGKNPVMRAYNKSLNFCIHHRLLSCVASVLVLVIFLGGIATAGMELIPAMDQGTVSVSVKMPIGSKVNETAEMSDRIMKICEDTIPEAESMYYSASDESSTVTVNLVGLSERERSSDQVGNQLRRDLADVAGADLSVSTSGAADMSSMTGSAIDVSITGDDLDELAAITKDLARRFEEIPQVTESKSSAEDAVPQVNVMLNRENAASFGLTAATVGSAVRAQIDGSTATELKIAGDEYDIVVRGDESSSRSLDAIKTIPIPLQSGGSVPLDLVANVTTEMAPQTISRENQQRMLSVTGTAEEGADIAAITRQVQAILDDYNFPEGYEYDMGGESEQMAESFSALGTALLVALALVYFVLASQFESFVMPVVIMLILPFGLLGGLFGLPLTGRPISMPALIGVIVLAGTVVNSSIILVDYIKTRRQKGEDKNTAILNACPRRVRPVMMTALTTVLGLLPMAFSMGEGNEMMKPMAIVMIFGMIISTFVTLFVTPVYYSVIDSITGKFHRRPGERPLPTEKKELDEALNTPGITD
ncbi:efflux RND transporter permease subunit [Intestinibacillus massiliensis]|uniref:efflux RND transporter permease subunit n=1 Tax=Intestinibacillus massiliensis TaxID=1871029 RepID=UPI000B34C6C4|nr:efflux RND transporter permease subunit [Intestinibacillus massiliensis]